MIKAYHEILPPNYFNDLFALVKGYVLRGECVLISAMYGMGNKTAFNFLTHQFKMGKVFDNVLTFDPQINTISLIRFTKNLDRSQRNLILVRFFEQIKNRPFLLEKLDSIRRKNPQNISFIMITDHTGITSPMEYVALTKPFFTQRIYMKPFTIEETKRMIDTFEKFYNWKIDKKNIPEIYKLSGGIPRFVKYICKEIVDEKANLGDTRNFLNVSNIFELEYLAKLIVQLARGEILKLGLIEQNGKIISKLLREYFKTYKSRVVSDLYPDLTEGETKIFSYLIENEGQIVTPDKIADLVDMSDENFSLWAIYKTISRLKPKVTNNFKIRNIKGKGYLLEKSDTLKGKSTS